MLNAIGSVTTSAGTSQPRSIAGGSWCLLHNMGSGIMASVVALAHFAGIPTIECSAMNDDTLLREVSAFESIVFQGWNPRFHQVIDRLEGRGHRFFVQWHTAMSGIETMGEGKIFADVFAHPCIERILWTHPEAAAFDHPRFLHLPNVAMHEQFTWLTGAPRADLEAPDELHLLQPTVNRPVKNALTVAFAAHMAVQAGVNLRFHVTHAFGNGDRCGPALRALFGRRLEVHPSLPVRAPRWGSLIKSVKASSHLSFSETYCYAAIESIVAGVPAILSRGLPIADPMSRDLDFLVVEPTDVAATCEAIRTLARCSEAERQAIAEKQLTVFRSYNRVCAERLVTTLLAIGVDIARCREGLTKLV